MASRFARSLTQKTINPPRWLTHNAVHYEVIMGSQSYGTSSSSSDMDIYGFVMPKMEILFPHTSGHILNFGTPPQSFDQWSEHHIKDTDYPDLEYDFSLYNIVKYFELCRQCNPNMIDSLFVDADCILHITELGVKVRENRHLFLSKLCWPKFKGYSYAQLSALDNKNPVGKRVELFNKYGFDTKHCYHLVRLLLEAEQIAKESNIELKRNAKILIDVRNGKWSETEVREFFAAKEKELDQAFKECKLPDKPDELKLRNLLMDCIEMHYGKISKEVTRVIETTNLDVLKEIHRISGEAINETPKNNVLVSEEPGHNIIILKMKVHDNENLS